MKLQRVLFLWVCLLATLRVSAQDTPDIRLTLPPTGYAVEGGTMNVYFDNVVLSQDSRELTFEVNSKLGTSDQSHWSVTPTAAQIGEHHWEVTVSKGNKTLARKSMTWVVSPAQVRKDMPVTLLIIGDSLTHATIYPNCLASRLADAGLSQWKMLGTHRPGNAAPGVAHEGYGGWTWKTFIEHYEPNPDADRAKRKHSSPFVFLNKEGKPELDVQRYVQETCQGSTADYVIIKLGINDCFSADPSTPEMTDVTINGMFENAEKLITEFRRAAPNAEIGICLTTPGNSREEAFKSNYEGRYPRWGWKRIQHRLVERQLEHFLNREAEKIHVIPMELNLDPVAGYPLDNAVHPNETGYGQIAESIHAWLMSRLHRDPQ